MIEIIFGQLPDLGGCTSRALTDREAVDRLQSTLINALKDHCCATPQPSTLARTLSQVLAIFDDFNAETVGEQFGSLPVIGSCGAVGLSDARLHTEQRYAARR
jgi:hypothetical protein